MSTAATSGVDRIVVVVDVVQQNDDGGGDGRDGAEVLLLGGRQPNVVVADGPHQMGR